MVIVNISEKVVKRIADARQVCFGRLFGIPGIGSTHIVALQSDVPYEENFEDSFPTPLELCGVFRIESRIAHYNVLEKYKDNIGKYAILLHIKMGSDLMVYLIEHGKSSQVEYNILSEQEINNMFLFIRVTGEFPLQCEYSANALNTAFHNIQKTISSGAMIFNISKTNIFLLENGSERTVVGANTDMVMSEICDDSNSFNEETHKKKKIQSSKPKFININMLKHLSKIESDHAPLCILDKNPIMAISTSVQCDSLLMVSANSKLGNLYPMLLDSVKKSIRLHKKQIMNILKNQDYDSIATKTYHFCPIECGHFLTLLYSVNSSEEHLRSYRETIHEKLLIKKTAPMFRKTNQFVFKKNSDGKQPLINPHEGLKSTDNGGTIALVRGKYEYYHYCQNKMDDNGWGCAYRSLQTLASWFHLQGYVAREVPTFQEIQNCLVSIKDKPANFLGSRQWIGSTEVGFVLNTLLGVDSKMMHVSSGAEMASTGPELVSHFQNHGSPVMIGGGSLAHTILGVDYNQQTGNLRFLILDPHYTGTEDLHVIQSKGWCGWKTVDFWDKKSFYNMCLPQVPKVV